ncbi:MAG TPA: rhodanese homology domain-containing protein [Dongiaceae bacterium]|nr:rhodanese homology domain-containing protein [Dongiaceae bacterium]
MVRFPTRSYADIRAALLDRREVALLDVREEAVFAAAHPLFAANASLSRLELDILARIPRPDTPITVYDDGEGLAERAAAKLREFGYTDVALLEGGLGGWRRDGGEIFQDVNAPSKAFGELVESKRHTPSLSAEEVKALIEADENVVVLDARRFDEYHTMSIPRGISVPGGELVLRAGNLVPDSGTKVIVNCAGRTRSIIGTQSLINAGITNRVWALRNGTIGWTLAGQVLDHGQSRRFPETDEKHRLDAANRARAVADRAGVRRLTLDELQAWAADLRRTTYIFDVRTPEEYAVGHLPGSRSVPGGQLVQETDHYATVRGARIVLVDDDGVRANMTGSWLAQMGWDVAVLDGVSRANLTTQGDWQPQRPRQPEVKTIDPATLRDWLAAGDTSLFDITTSANYVAGHIPGAHFALRADLPAFVTRSPAKRYVLTCGSSLLAKYAAGDLAAVTQQPVHVLEGGTAAWRAAGLPLEQGEQNLASPRIDRYRRPYEGTDNPREAMQAYLDWEFGLVAQLERDGTHGFFVI